jgi:ElaA protein
MSAITYHTVTFQALSCDTFHDIIGLRERVFVVEQDCPYLDVDGKDPKCMHVYALRNNEVVGYCRVIPPGLSYEMWSIGRVVTDERVRRKGVGTAIMRMAMAYIDAEQPSGICISAQTYLKGFYENLGFQATGLYYLEDNLPHMQMKRM